MYLTYWLWDILWEYLYPNHNTLYRIWASDKSETSKLKDNDSDGLISIYYLTINVPVTPIFVAKDKTGCMVTNIKMFLLFKKGRNITKLICTIMCLHKKSYLELLIYRVNDLVIKGLDYRNWYTHVMERIPVFFLR